MKRKKRYHHPLRVEVFSPAEIRLVQDAVNAFEGWLRQAGNATPKKALVEETVRQVKSKLEMMQTAPHHLLPFEYNEIVLLHAAIQDYMLGLLAGSQTPQRAEQLRRCEHIQGFARRSLQAAQRKTLQD